MTKRLYFYQTWPLDPDHAPTYYFDHGVVEIEPEELDEITKQLEAANHWTLVTVTPVDDIVLDLAGFQAAIGKGIRDNHDNEWNREAACDGDRTFLEAAAEKAEDQDDRDAFLRLSRGEVPRREWDALGLESDAVGA